MNAKTKKVKKDDTSGKPENKKEASPAISPRTRRPVEDPESQEVERIHYDMQTSLASHPDKKKENETD